MGREARSLLPGTRSGLPDPSLGEAHVGVQSSQKIGAVEKLSGSSAQLWEAHGPGMGGKLRGEKTTERVLEEKI